MNEQDDIEIPEGHILVEGLSGEPTVLAPDGRQFPLSRLSESHQSWMDEDPQLLDDALHRRQTNRTALMDWLWGTLVSGTDYGQGKANQKPSLWQPGAEKLCGYLDLTPRFPDALAYVQRAAGGLPIDDVVVRCHLYDAAGRLIGEGMGAREASQNPKLNDRIKMAQKSALIDAVKRTAGLSEVFTQDETDESAGAALDKEAIAYLESVAQRLFPDTWKDVLYSLAKRRFHFSDGDWQLIPMARLADAIRSLEDKAGDAM